MYFRCKKCGDIAERGEYNEFYECVLPEEGCSSESGTHEWEEVWDIEERYTVKKYEVCKMCKGRGAIDNPLYDEFWKEYEEKIKEAKWLENDRYFFAEFYPAWFEKHGLKVSFFGDYEEIECPHCDGGLIEVTITVEQFIKELLETKQVKDNNAIRECIESLHKALSVETQLETQ